MKQTKLTLIYLVHGVKEEWLKRLNNQLKTIDPEIAKENINLLVLYSNSSKYVYDEDKITNIFYASKNLNDFKVNYSDKLRTGKIIENIDKINSEFYYIIDADDSVDANKLVATIKLMKSHPQNDQFRFSNILIADPETKKTFNELINQGDQIRVNAALGVGQQIDLTKNLIKTIEVLKKTSFITDEDSLSDYHWKYEWMLQAMVNTFVTNYKFVEDYLYIYTRWVIKKTTETQHLPSVSTHILKKYEKINSLSNINNPQHFSLYIEKFKIFSYIYNNFNVDTEKKLLELEYIFTRWNSANELVKGELTLKEITHDAVLVKKSLDDKNLLIEIEEAFKIIRNKNLIPPKNILESTFKEKGGYKNFSIKNSIYRIYWYFSKISNYNNINFDNSKNILYSIDNNTYKLFCVSLASFIRHNKFKNIFIMYNSEQFKYLNNLKKKFSKANIKFIDIKNDIQKLIKIKSNIFRPLTPESYGRLFIEKYVDEERVLYIDTDTYCVADISELFNFNLNKAIAATPEIFTSTSKRMSIESFWKRDWELTFDIHAKLIDIPLIEYQNYFNSGTLLMNIIKLKKINFSEKAIKWHENNSIRPFNDQDILNHFFIKEYIKLGPQYNYCWTTIDDKEKIKHQKIIHFTGNKKPIKISNFFSSNLKIYKLKHKISFYIMYKCLWGIK